MHSLIMLLTVLACATACADVDAGQHAASVLPVVTPVNAESPAQDSTMIAAGRALEQGRPWEASRLLAPLLRDPVRRTPATVLRAAEAASAWEGWDRVVALLDGEPWLDSAFAGRGHSLLASAALTMSPRSARTDSVALLHARGALGARGDEASGVGRISNAERGQRHTLLARALDRRGDDDSARVHYARGGELIPEIRDWLILRAANVTRDESMRAGMLRSVRTDVAQGRRDLVEASALERQREHARAAPLYLRAGAPAAAFRVRNAAADDAARAMLRGEMLEFLRATRGAADTRQTIELLDLQRVPGTPADALVIARAAARWGPIARAAVGYAAVFASTAGATSVTDQDRITYGDVLMRLGRSRDAAAQFGAVPARSPLRGTARYHRARALLRAGDGAAARVALQDTERSFPADTFAAAASLYLLGDLESDAGRDEAARQYFRRLIRRYPTSSPAPQARLRAALMTYAAGNARAAARELDSLVVLHPAHAEAPAARYWAGRAWKNAGDAPAARARFTATMEAREMGYYAMLAATALGRPAWTPAVAAAAPSRFSDIDSAATRMALLDRLGMNEEAGWEEEWLASSARTSTARTLATAAALAGRGNASRAIALARAALDSGAAPTADVYRLLYPLLQEDVLRVESRRRGLDPALVAALIRQESNFTPHAVSAVGARGLMQVMPSVGKSIAPSIGITEWDPALLFQPDVNVQIGVRHLAASLARHEHPAYALAAYNAGESRARRWRAKRGGSDPALFVELIPFVETRDYVRIVLRNREFYRALYPER